MHLSCWSLFLLVSSSRALIVTDKLVTLMHIVFSSIPPVSKGVDSRFGIGYRFGPFADAQVVWELGPQSLTEPLAPAPQEIDNIKRYASFPDESFRRHAPRNPAKVPGILELPDNSLRGRALALNRSYQPPQTDSEALVAGSDWLSRWRAGLSQRSPRSNQDAVAPSPRKPIRIALASTTTPSPTGPRVVVPNPEAHLRNTMFGMTSTSSAPPRRARGSTGTGVSRATGSQNHTKPAEHLSMAMASLRTTPPSLARIPSTPGPAHIAVPRPGAFRVLRQLWLAAGGSAG